MQRRSNWFWFIKKHREDVTSTYIPLPHSKPLSSESGHTGVVEQCEEE